MDPLVLVAGFAGLSALVWKFVDFLRLVADLPRSLNGVVTQVIAWVAGIAAVFLYGASQFGDRITVAGIRLSDMDGPTKLLVGLVISSVASAAVDYKQARDGTDSAAKPPLVGARSTPPP